MRWIRVRGLMGVEGYESVVKDVRCLMRED